MSHKHLIYMSQPHFALLTQENTAGSRSLWDPPSPPATFPPSKLAQFTVSGCAVDFPQLKEKPYFVFIYSFLSDFSSSSREAELHSCRPYQTGIA